MYIYLQHPRPAKFLPFLQKLLFWSRSNYFCSQAFFCFRDKFRCSLTIATAFFANQTAFFADQTAFFADHFFRGVSQRRFFFVTAFFHYNNWNFYFSRQRQKFCTTGCCRYMFIGYTIWSSTLSTFNSRPHIWQEQFYHLTCGISSLCLGEFPPSYLPRTRHGWMFPRWRWLLSPRIGLKTILWE